MTIENIIRSKNIICGVNFIILSVAFYLEGGFEQPSITEIAGLLGLSFSPLIWNRWLYEGLFESERSKLIVSYKSFQVIGLLMAVAVFLSITLAYDWGAHQQ